MRILITAKYISGTAEEGGSSRFFATVARTLTALGHDVFLSNQPESLIDTPFDLIICSHHEILRQIKDHPAPKLCISHGIIGDEQFTWGADRYISVSEEVRTNNKTRGIDSEVIGQPIEMPKQTLVNAELKNILVIRRHTVDPDPFTFLSEKYDVRISDPAQPIEDQIAWADLCITLGRGALESMAQGKPVIVADSRLYHAEICGHAAIGDGYVTPELIGEMARNNFSGRRFRIPITREWLEAELEKYDPADAYFLRAYVKGHHDAENICAQYLIPIIQKPKFKIGFGCMINNMHRFSMVLQQSAIPGVEYIKDPDRATTALNELMDRIEAKGNDVAILTHQDMLFRPGWIDKVKDQLAALPDDWVVSGIIGKDAEGRMCGRFRDTRIPQHFNTSHIHTFPYPAACFDEAVIIVNLKSGFRFDESLDGFDLYGTLAVLQAWEMGGSAWVIDAPAEHYCTRQFTWEPDEQFKRNYQRLWNRFSNLYRVDSTAIGTTNGGDARDLSPRAFMTSAA